jgi:sortase A
MDSYHCNWKKKGTDNLPLSTPKARVVPKRLIISSIELDAPIVQSKKDEVVIDSKVYFQWYAPDEFAVGWQNDSATLGEIGNTVLNGHHNVHGEVLKNLEKVKEGDRILIYGTSDNLFTYVVTNIMILPERDVTLDQRLDNAKWMLSTADERITLISCWPYYSNTHRLIVVARPEIIDFKELIH